jgi:hypothetical protein
MELLLVIGLVLAVILVVLAIRAISGIVKVAMAIFGIIILLGAFFTIIILIDVRQARTAINEGDKVLLYGDDDAIFAGVRMEHGSGGVSYDDSFPSGISALEASELREYEDAFANNTIGKEGYEVVFLMNESVFKEVMVLSLGSQRISGTLAREAIASDDPIETIAAGLKITENAVKNVFPSSETETKAILFLLLFDQVQKEQGITYLLKKVQSDEIRILPAFLTIKVLKLIPERMVTRTAERIMAEKEAKLENEGNRSAKEAGKVA